MIFRKFLSEESVFIDNTKQSRESALSQIAKLAKKNPVLKNFTEEKIYDALLEREKVSPTGFQDGIAIPHCSFGDMDDFVLGIYINKQGVNFNSMDGKVSKIFFYIIRPEKFRNKHIQILSSISRYLQSSKNFKALLKAANEAELLEYIMGAPEIEAEFKIPEPKSLFHVFIQKKEFFSDILQIFSEVVDGQISVIETNNAGYYLNALPLFTTFWSDEHKISCKIIIAVVDKKITNHVIRRINTIIPEIDSGAGVLLTVSDLFYSNGSIDF